ncbi:MAG: hypothetical protein JWP61_2374, partial [Friedmanniella sp.]|nr:hypothetical protein [Friedmanniella sp.]
HYCLAHGTAQMAFVPVAGGATSATGERVDEGAPV